MSTGSVTVRLNLNKDGYSAGMTAARKQAQQLGQEMKAAGHTTVSEMQAASASIRVLEGGMTGNIRAAERFISTIPGVGKALQGIFPLVGGIALAGVFVKIGTEAAKAIETVLKMPQAVSNSFRSMNQAAQTTNDTLALTNDRLANEILKLEGKPQNNLAISIDETRLAADKLAESLDRDNQKIAQMLEQHHIGGLAALVTGRAGTADVEGSVNYYNQQLSNLGADKRAMVDNPLAARQIQRQIDEARASALAYAQSQIQQRSNQGPGGLNQQGNLEILRGFQTTLTTQGDQQENENRNAQLQTRKAADDAVKAAQEAAKKLLEQQKQAQELIVQQWHKDYDEAKSENNMTLAQDAQFWVQRMEGARRGSLSYVAAQDEANKLIAQMRRENATGQTEFAKTAGASYLPSAQDQGRGDTSLEERQARQDAEYVHTLNEQISAQRQAAAAVAEESIQMAVAAGRMSQLDAAQVRATLHTQEYQRAQEQLQIALANAAQMPGEAGRTAVAGLTGQAAAMAGQRQIQGQQDAQAIASQQLGPAMTQALGIMVNDFTNMTRTIVAVTTRAMDSFNDDIVKAMMGKGKAADFGKTFTQAGEGLLKGALQNVEGRILSKLGLGGLKKADGSAGAPYHVIIAGAGGGLGGAAAGAGSDSDSAASSGWLASIFKFVQPFVGGLMGHAAGGDVLANYPSIVGERGPELFVPRGSGTIVPNHALGGSSHTYMIDARGSNDPMAVEAAVARALPHAVAASMQADHQRSKRTPQGR